MNIIKLIFKRKKIISFFALLIIFFTPIAYGLEEPPMSFQSSTPEKLEFFTPEGIFVRVLNWFFNIVIILGIIFIIYAGFTYITSSGDPSKTKRALQILMYALIGIAIAILAKALIRLVAEFISPGIGTQLKFPGL